MIVQTKPPAKAPVAVSLGVVFLCLALGGSFVWWYARATGQSASVKFSAADLASIQSPGRQSGYNQPRFNNGPFGPRPRLVKQPPSDPDGVFPSLGSQVIRAAQVQVRVQTALAAGAPPAIVFRQRSWGLLQDTPVFSIARRIVHEDALARQLEITPEQLKQLTDIVATPPLKGSYIAALPVDPADIDAVRKAWAAYLTAQPAAAPNSLPTATAELLAVVREIGTRAMSKARQDYAEADKNINAVLETRQIEAYRKGKPVAATK